jgi:hypothetical protein
LKALLVNNPNTRFALALTPAFGSQFIAMNYLVLGHKAAWLF